MNKENRKVINCLYAHFKDSPKKLKIICDWDEVIQPHEPYAFWEVARDEDNNNFREYFENYWQGKLPMTKIEYSSYGSRLVWNFPPETLPKGNLLKEEKFLEKQSEIKNSPNFYQEAPFLSIAKELLMLIKADKVEKLIFLSAYDKRVFPDGRRKCPDCFASTGDDTKKAGWEPCEKCPITSGDPRKKEIFIESFAKFRKLVQVKGFPHKEQHRICKLVLIPFDSEVQGQTKADWIKKNAPDFDLVIDDNPNICREVIRNNFCEECKDYCDVPCSECPKKQMTVLAPYYLTIKNQHDERVLLVKNSVSDLKKEDFKNEYENE